MSDAGQGWIDSPARLFRHRVMLEMARGESDCVDIAASLEAGPTEVQQVFVDLVRDELAAHSPLRVGDEAPQDAYLTATGKARVRSWEEARTPAWMKRSCMPALLSWLDENEGYVLASTDLFSNDVRGNYYGRAFPIELVVQACWDLMKHDLAKGIKYSPACVMQPAITTTGHMVHTQFGGDIAAWLAATSGGRGDTFHISNSTGVTVASRSPGAQQSVYVTTDAREQFLNLAAALEQMLDALGLEPADIARAHGLVGQLREAAEVVESEPGRARRVLENVKAIAVNGTGSAAGTALVALVEAISHQL